jgi:RimJ/RimL family protein N-acetyltransferase
MKAPELETTDSSIRLIAPDVQRDSELGVQWLNGELGRATMQLMGNSDDEIETILPTTTELEAERVKDFLVRTDQLNWMIEYNGSVVGSVWVDLKASGYLPSPSVHIMIGDPTVRGQGVGSAAIGAVIQHLQERGFKVIYSRHLLSNKGSSRLLRQKGFIDLGEPYNSDTLEFQNVVLEVT